MNFKITSIHAVVGVDYENGDEGVWAYMGPDGAWMPMVMADEARFRSVIPIAEKMAKETGRSFRILSFCERKDVTEDFLAKYGSKKEG